MQYNVIKNIANQGIGTSNVGGQQIRINYIDSFCVILNDCGGIYRTSANNSNPQVIDGNIVLDGIGDTTNNFVAGIYLDENASNETVTNNTVANTISFGIKGHKTAQ